MVWLELVAPCEHYNVNNKTQAQNNSLTRLRLQSIGIRLDDESQVWTPLRQYLIKQTKPGSENFQMKLTQSLTK